MGPTAALGIGTRPVLKWAFCYKKVSKSSYLQSTLLFTKLIHLCVQADPWTNPEVRRRKPWGIQWGSWHLSAHRRVSDPQAQVSSIMRHCFQITQMGAFLIGVFRVIWRTSVLCVVVFRKHSLVLNYVLPNGQGKSQCSPCKCSSSYWASQSVCCQQRLDFSTFTGLLTASLLHAGKAWLLLRGHFPQCIALASVCILMGLLTFLFNCEDTVKSLYNTY